MPEGPSKSFMLNALDNDSSYQPGNNHLLLIGIDAYQQVARLSNAVRDAQTFKKVLHSKYTFEPERTYELFDEGATRKRIMGQMRTLTQTVQPDDNLVVFFSGHGHYDERMEEGYWVPVDAEYDGIDDYISYSFITKAIKAIPAQHTVFIVDSCYSGAVLMGDRDLGSERFERDPSRWMIASGRNEVVPDGIAGKHSPFADKLIDILDRYATEGLRMGSLVDKLITSVTSNSKQTPIGRPLYEVGDQGGEFFFRPRRNQAADYQAAMDANTAQAWKTFLQAYPDSTHKAEIETRITALQEQEAWTEAQKRNTITAYRKYRQQFPDGAHRSEALDNIEQLEANQDWLKAQRRNTISGYERFLERHPNCQQRPGAEAAMKVLESSAPEPEVDHQRKAETPPQQEATHKPAPTGQSRIVAAIQPDRVEGAAGSDLILLPNMIYIPGGTFEMGSDLNRRERPVHSVTVSSFYLAETPVTFEQFDYFCAETGHKNPPDKGWGRANSPVINVSWEDAQAYIQWLHRQPGQAAWRLPTEAEWEYAAGGGAENRTIWAGTDDQTSLENYAWYGESKTQPVGEKAPNGLGLYDMCGNVMEWCSDRYAKDYYDNSPDRDPTGPTSGSSRAVRGGCYYTYSPKNLRVANRDFYYPGFRDSSLGFRLARTP